MGKEFDALVLVGRRSGQKSGFFNDFGLVRSVDFSPLACGVVLSAQISFCDGNRPDMILQPTKTVKNPISLALMRPIPSKI